ncbi:MAG: hypothetical protein AAGK33_01245 [Pseudomonadota bacterium]
MAAKDAYDRHEHSFSLLVDTSKTLITASSILMTAMLAFPRVVTPKGDLGFFFILPQIPFVVVIFLSLWVLFKAVGASKSGDTDPENPAIETPFGWSLIFMFVGMLGSILYVGIVLAN